MKRVPVPTSLQHVDPAPEQRRVLLCDRQPEPGSGADPGRIRLVEPLEEVRNVLWRDSRAVVAHLDEGPRAVTADVDDDLTPP